MPDLPLLRDAAVVKSGRPSDHSPSFANDPVMRCSTAGRILLDADQPMQSLSRGKLDAVGVTLSMIDRFHRRLPA
jgi:hypothetical protein